jgi:hypothetical protein
MPIAHSQHRQLEKEYRIKNTVSSTAKAREVYFFGHQQA